MSCSKKCTLAYHPSSLVIAIILPLFWSVRTVGDEPARLTTDGTLKLTPVFINNGNEVAFATHEKANLVSIVRLNVHDGSRRRQHPTVVNHQFDPAYLGEGRLHAYARSATAPQMILVIQDTQEKKDWIFRPTDARATARSPSFAPEGSRIAFNLADVQGSQIASVNAQGQDLKYLTRAAGINAWPCYSPDGREIAFASSRTGDFEIFVMNADGSGLKRLTNSPGMDVRPAWAPDGKSLSFTSNRDANYDIYIMNADGSNPRNLTSHPARDDHSAWHPDGRKLLFVSDRDGGSDLYLLMVP